METDDGDAEGGTAASISSAHDTSISDAIKIGIILILLVGFSIIDEKMLKRLHGAFFFFIRFE